MDQHLHTASWPNRSLRDLHPRFYTCPVNTASSGVHKQSSQWIRLQAVPRSLHQSEKDCKHNLYTHTACWYYLMDKQCKWKHKTLAMQLKTLKFGADTGNSTLVFLVKYASASVAASGYGLPFNSHGESTNILSNKQIHLAWTERDSCIHIAYFCTALMSYPNNWEAHHSLLLSSICWSVWWCLQKAFISRCATYAYHILQISSYNLHQAVYLRIM